MSEHIGQGDEDKYVLKEVGIERYLQDRKWGEQNHPDGTSESAFEFQREAAKLVCDRNFQNKCSSWVDILREEVYEAFCEVDQLKLRAELIQVAAVAVAWIECIDRNRDG